MTHTLRQDIARSSVKFLTAHHPTRAAELAGFIARATFMPPDNEGGKTIFGTHEITDPSFNPQVFVDELFSLQEQQGYEIKAHDRTLAFVIQQWDAMIERSLSAS